MTTPHPRSLQLVLQCEDRKDRQPRPRHHRLLRLPRPGTLLIFDNVVREGKVLNPSSDDPAVRGVRRLNQALAVEPRVSATILASIDIKKYDGMAISVVL